MASGAWAQGTTTGDKEGGTTCTVKQEEVKTWTMRENDKDYEVRPATPGYEGDTGLFHMSTAYTLPKGKASVSLFRDNLDRDPKDIDWSIHGISAAYGVTSRLEIFGNMGIQNRVKTAALFQPGFFNELPLAGTQTTNPSWQTGFGDIKLGVKYGFLDDYRGDAVGLALRGLIKLGTADEAKGLGTGKISALADLVASKNLSHVAEVHASIGYEINSDPDNINIANALRWGVGVNLPTCRIFQVQAEVMGLHYGDADVKQTDPVDLVVGPVFWIKPGFFIRPALSVNIHFNDRGLNQGFVSHAGRQISIGYHPGTHCCAIAAPAPPPPPPAANRNPTVSCSVERSEIRPGETARVRASGSDPDGDPLTYEWSASAGRISGTGTEASFDSTGVTASTTVTITVRASDGRGGTASSTCSVRVATAAPPRVEPLTCTSGGFPRNLARLNNVDKACLDDVASRLRQDPRSRIIIIGYADSQERHAEVVGRTRAEAVKNYLVRERGVDESRLSVRSGGSSKPVDTGTSAQARARNRRVDVIFVPEGATVPEDDE
jgi:flagellar motor protein MotB